MFFKKDYLIVFEACGKDYNYIGTGTCTYSKRFRLNKKDLETIKDNCIASCRIQNNDVHDVIITRITKL